MRAHVTYGPSAEELAAEVESKDLALIRAVLEAAASHMLDSDLFRGDIYAEQIRALSPQAILDKCREGNRG